MNYQARMIGTMLCGATLLASLAFAQVQAAAPAPLKGVQPQGGTQQNVQLQAPSLGKMPPPAQLQLKVSPEGVVGQATSVKVLSSVAVCKFEIDWADGTPRTSVLGGIVVTHYYNKVGAYDLLATAVSGCTGSASAHLVIRSFSMANAAKGVDVCVIRVCHPLIHDLSESTFTPGDKLTIQGEDFGNFTGEVVLQDNPMQLISWSPTKIVVTDQRHSFDGRYDLFIRTSQGNLSPTVQVQFNATRKNVSLGPNRIDVKYCAEGTSFNQCNGQHGGPEAFGQVSLEQYPAIHGFHWDLCSGPTCWGWPEGWDEYWIQDWPQIDLITSVNGWVDSCWSTENGRQQDGCQMEVEQHPAGDRGHRMLLRVHWKNPPKTKASYKIDVKVQAQIGFHP